MTSFSDLALDARILKAVAETGYTTPTPIQAQAIPSALEGRDVLGIAQTGTGKTASFTLPLLTRLARGRARARMPRSLVLAPTRELAAQVAENFDTYAKYLKLTRALLIGGVSFKEQDLLIDRGVDVLIATPGRLLDHFERGKLLLTGVEVMVVDEADRMLDMGFIPDIERIFQLTPFTRQTLFFSATMAPEIERITNAFLTNPVRVEVARQATASETITQGLVEVAPSRRDRSFAEKRAVLRALIRSEGAECRNAIIFCNRKVDVDVLAKSLKSHGFNAAPIHGDLDQSVRMRTLDAFRDGSLQFLIASDVAARGLDIPDVSHVFNFDVPSHAEDYVHRIGRTGRAGRDGRAFTIATPSDEKYLAAVEGLIRKSIPRIEAPGLDREIAAAKAMPKPRDEAEAAGERRGRRGGRNPRRGSGEGREAAAAAPVAAAVAAPFASPVATPEPAAEAAPVQASAPVAPPAAAPAREPKADRREDRRDDRRRGREPVVVGMGDHVPEFLMRAFRSTTTSDTEADEIEPETETGTAE